MTREEEIRAAEKELIETTIAALIRMPGCMDSDMRDAAVKLRELRSGLPGKRELCVWRDDCWDELDPVTPGIQNSRFMAKILRWVADQNEKGKPLYYMNPGRFEGTLREWADELEERQ